MYNQLLEYILSDQEKCHNHSCVLGKSVPGMVLNELEMTEWSQKGLEEATVMNV